MNVQEDPAVNAIEALSSQGGKPTFAWLKAHFGQAQISKECYESLHRGRAVIGTVDQLDQYLFSYAPMVASQWQHASKHMAGKSSEGGTRLIDYGCGQGLAGLLLNDELGSEFLEDVRTITAIEPSSVALRRAIAIYRGLAPKASVTSVNKSFDALQHRDLTLGSGPAVHIFSNVLDIDGYDHVALFRKALIPGTHVIIALGHDRTVHGYSQGLQKVKAAVDACIVRPGMTIHASHHEIFACGNRGEPAILWICKLEVGNE